MAHRMRNPAVKAPEDVWSEFRLACLAAYQCRAIARDLAAGVVADYSRKHDSAVACFMDDFEACIAHLRLPVTHRRAIRTTNLLERLFVEERRRLKIIPNAFGERLEADVWRAHPLRRRWKSIRSASSSAVSRGREEGTRLRIRGPSQSHSQPSKGAAQTKISSSSQT